MNNMMRLSFIVCSLLSGYAAVYTGDAVEDTLVLVEASVPVEYGQYSDIEILEYNNGYPIKVHQPYHQQTAFEALRQKLSTYQTELDTYTDGPLYTIIHNVYQEVVKKLVEDKSELLQTERDELQKDIFVFINQFNQKVTIDALQVSQEHQPHLEKITTSFDQIVAYLLNNENDDSDSAISTQFSQTANYFFDK